MAPKIKVYLVRYVIDGEVRWMSSSFDFKIANEVCKKLARRGMRPTLFRIAAEPNHLIACGIAWRRVA